MARQPKRIHKTNDQNPPAEASSNDRPSSGIRGPWQTILAIGLIVLASLIVYSNSFGGAFILDDISSILDNPTIERLWPLSTVLSPPSAGETVSGRPLLNLSLALNWIASGKNPQAVWGFHATNLAIHIAVGLLLFGILRRTFLVPRLRERWGDASTWLALAITLLWTVHPLQTESVTYVIQRAESLVSLFYLMTLYCTIRGAESQRPSVWYGIAIATCLLGMATKEVMLTAPAVVFLYDRTFLAGSMAEAMRRRWGLYLGLIATWALLATLVLSAGQLGHRTDVTMPDAFSYACTQPGVILYYLWLSIWPNSLCVFYRWPVGEPWYLIAPGVLLLGLLAIATLYGLIRNKPWSFLGVWFFFILAPTSSIIPLADLAFEHRMYLPLAAVIVLAVLGGYALCQTIVRRQMAASSTVNMLAFGLVALACVLLGSVTLARNNDYRTPIAIWQDTVAKAPYNSRAHVNFGTLLESKLRIDEAIGQFTMALELDPQSAEAHSNLATLLARKGRPQDAIRHFKAALDIDPQSAVARSNYGIVLAGLGRTAEAKEQYEEAIRIDSQCFMAHVNLGVLLENQKKGDEAIEHYEKALAIKELPDIHFNLALVLQRTGRREEAITHFQRTVELKPNDSEARQRLRALLNEQGRSAPPSQR
jgi:protein O-mannosyl-transferase